MKFAPEAVICSVLISFAPTAPAPARSASCCCADTADTSGREQVHARMVNFRIARPSVSWFFKSELVSRLEQLNRIAVRVFQLDLFAAWSYLHLIPEMESRLL